MIWSILVASGAGFLSAVIFLLIFQWTNSRRLWNCECDLADLQDRHLRTVRRDAAKGRWDKETELDAAMDVALQPVLKKKGWTKWPSSDQSVNS